MKAIHPITKPSSTSIYSFVPELNKRRQPSRSSSHSQFSKSASLPLYFLNKARIQEITHAYRSISTDKILTHSTRPSTALTPSKTRTPFAQRQPSQNNDKQKARLTIQRGRENTGNTKKETSGSWAELTIKLRSISDRFQVLLDTRS